LAQNLVVGCLKSIFASGEDAEVADAFIVGALQVGRFAVDGARRRNLSPPHQWWQWQGRRSWLKAGLERMVVEVVSNEMPSCGAYLGDGSGGTGGAPTCDD
jgi:hypothetical protein